MFNMQKVYSLPEIRKIKDMGMYRYYNAPLSAIRVVGGSSFEIIFFWLLLKISCCSVLRVHNENRTPKLQNLEHWLGYHGPVLRAARGHTMA
jgi:hypothetical protein